MEKKILIGLLLTLVIVVFIPIYWIGEPARQERAVRRQQDQAMEMGAETFVALCANCHGPQGQGLIGPALKGTNLNKETLLKVIIRGRMTNRLPMPAWGTEDGGPLKKHQIDNLVLFIQNWDEHILETAVVKHEALVPLPEEPVAIGKQMFTTVGCSFCHGGGGEGTNFAPPLAGATRERIVRQVRQPRTPLMPAYTAQHLSDANMEKVVSFLLTLKSPPPPTPSTATSGTPSAEAQVITQGAQLFNSLGCGACHGPEGKGTAIGSNITGKSREEITKQMRTPKGTMPAFPANILSDADLDKLVAYIMSLKK